MEPYLDEERVALVALALVRGLGAKLITRLQVQFGSLGEALTATHDQLLQVRGVGRLIADRIRAINLENVSLDLIRYQKTLGIRAITWNALDYPACFSTLEDKPPVIFCRGTLLSHEIAAAPTCTVAIVGTRQPQIESVQAAWTLGMRFASLGWTVISGLARGIDIAAHHGALDGGGRTIAVLGCGVNNVYPPEHAPVADRIIRKGALISEVHPSETPAKDKLVLRNRLITALSAAVVVIEAGEVSGALHAAKYAEAQGRPVYVMANSAGNRALLAEKRARLLPPSADILVAEIEAGLK